MHVLAGCVLPSAVLLLCSTLHEVLLSCASLLALTAMHLNSGSFISAVRISIHDDRYDNLHGCQGYCEQIAAEMKSRHVLTLQSPAFCMQVAHVNASGTMFLIHPQVYLVHRPHPKSSAQALYTNTQDGPNAAGRAVPLAKLFHRKVRMLSSMA